MMSAIALSEDANRDAELSLALFAIVTLAPNVVSLQQAGIAQQNEDANNFRAATQLIGKDSYHPKCPDPKNPNYPFDGNGAPMSAVAAAFNQQKTVDQTLSDTDNKNLENLVETTKSGATMLGNSLSNILEFAQPLFELFAQIRSIIAGI